MQKQNQNLRYFSKGIGVIGFLVVVIFALSFFFVSDKTYGINKTVSWQWDITNFLFWIPFLVLSLLAILILIPLIRRIRRKINSK